MSVADKKRNKQTAGGWQLVTKLKKESNGDDGDHGRNRKRQICAIKYQIWNSITGSECEIIKENNDGIGSPKAINLPRYVQLYAVNG
jgi:hypothetical protein